MKGNHQMEDEINPGGSLAGEVFEHDQPTSTIKPPDKFECPKCGKVFDRLQGLRMHNIRAHTEGGQRGYKWKQRTTRAEVLEKRREYQRRLRDRYYSEGKDSKGQIKPPGWKPNPRRIAAAQKRFAKKSYSTTLTGERREAYLARVRAYGRKWYAKKKANKIEPIVYHAETPETTEVRRATLPKHCPNCGENIAAWRKE
jgi:predicted RNA-binding Zn-ribbon protein involved in translation (DUF1610 family)